MRERKKELLDLLKGNIICTDFFDISYDKEIDEIYLSSKHFGFTVTKDFFLQIIDLESYDGTDLMSGKKPTGVNKII